MSGVWRPNRVLLLISLRLGHGRLEESFVVTASFDELFVQLREIV